MRPSLEPADQLTSLESATTKHLAPANRIGQSK